MNTIKSNKVSTTDNCELFYDQFKDGFGNVVKAKMEGNVKHIDYMLTLTNDRGEEMIIEGGLSAGYAGKGSNGTIRILRSAGFDFDDDFVYNNESFEIQK